MPGDNSTSDDARSLVEELLSGAIDRRASDLHLEPTAKGLEARYRVDGLLEVARTFEAATGRSLVIRLMVMAQLLTYRMDIPQEGRVTFASQTLGRPIDLRLAVMPTTHGLRAAIRMPAELTQPQNLEMLELPPQTLTGLRGFTGVDTGLLLLTGPAGAGKTTTIYALLTHLVQYSPGLSIMSLEDPVERDVPGVTQIEVSPFGQLTYERVLRSLLRQDPQVLVLGEIRDAPTAALAAQAALSGHRLISTMHAATPGGAIVRLLEMGLEPYQVASALYGVVAMRLVRRSDRKGGYRGRVPVAEFARVDDALREAILRRASGPALDQELARRDGYERLSDVAAGLVARGVTDAAEIQRAMGITAPLPLPGAGEGAA